MNSVDHRWGCRFAVGMNVELRSPEGWHARAVMRNVSLSGALIEAPADFPLSSQVYVRPLLPQAQWMRAFLVRHAGPGFGVEWVEPGMNAVTVFTPTSP